MKVIDNFLPNDIHQQFVDLLMSNDFPYYFIDGVANINGTEDDFIFFHNLLLLMVPDLIELGVYVRWNFLNWERRYYLMNRQLINI